MAGNEQLKAFRYAAYALLALGKRGVFHGIVYYERGLDKLILNEFVECQRQQLALGGCFVVKGQLYLLCKLARLFVRCAAKEVSICVFLHGVVHAQPCKRRGKVNVVLAVFYLGGAVYQHAAAGEQILAQLHHSVVIGIRLIYLNRGELGVMRSVHTLVAEKAAYFINPFKSANYAALEVQLRGDAQIHVYIQRIVVRYERPCARAGGGGVEHGGLDLYKVKLVQPPAYLGLYLGALYEGVSHLGIYYKVNAALAVSQFLILQPVELFGQGTEGL